MQPSPLNIDINCSKNNEFIVNGSFSVELHLLKKDHYQWSSRASRFNEKWGTPRTNDQEREIVLAHEYDHYKTYEKFITYLEELNKWEREKCNCNRGGGPINLPSKIHGLYQDARDHSKLFDSPPRNQGGMYDTYPFNPVTTLE